MSEPLDLSVLARVSGEAPPTAPPRDAPPTLPDGSEPTRREQTRSGAAPSGTSGPRTARPGQRRTRPRPEQGTPDPPQPRIVRDDDAPKEYRPGILVKPLTDLYVALGTMMYPVSQPVGTAFIQNAGPCAESLDELARTNPAARRFLMSLLTTGAWGKVIAAHLPILLAIGVTYSPAVRQAMAGPTPTTENDATETVNPVSNGFVRDTRAPRQP